MANEENSGTHAYWSRFDQFRCVTDVIDCFYFDLSVHRIQQMSYKNDTHRSIDNVCAGDCPTLVHVFSLATIKCAAFNTLIIIIILEFLLLSVCLSLLFSHHFRLVSIMQTNEDKLSYQTKTKRYDEMILTQHVSESFFSNFAQSIQILLLTIVNNHPIIKHMHGLTF